MIKAIFHTIVLGSASAASAQADSTARFSIEAGYRISKEAVKTNTGEGSYEACGYCDQSAVRNNTGPVYGGGAYVQLGMQKERLLLSLQVGITEWQNEIEGVKRTDYYHPHASYSIEQFHEYSVRYSATARYLNLSLGIGFNLLNPRKTTFRFGPVFRMNPEFLLSEKVKTSYVTDHYKYSAAPPNASNNEETYSYAGDASAYIFKPGNSSRRLNASVGMTAGGMFSKSFGLNLEAGFKFQQFSRVSFLDIEQKGTLYAQGGVFYQFR